MTHRSLAVLALAAALFSGGCLVNSHSRTSYSGRYVGPETMAQIEPGTTRQDFVLATLGEPTSKNRLDDGSEIWRWEYRRKRSSSGSVFLLLDTDNHTEHDGAAYVQFRDGVVERSWRD